MGSVLRARREGKLTLHTRKLEHYAEDMTTLTPAHTILKTEKLPLQPVLPADCCPAGALWRVWLARGELLFCGHHARQYGFAGSDSHSAYASVEENRQKGPS